MTVSTSSATPAKPVTSKPLDDESSDDDAINNINNDFPTKVPESEDLTKFPPKSLSVSLMKLPSGQKSSSCSDGLKPPSSSTSKDSTPSLSPSFLPSAQLPPPKGKKSLPKPSTDQSLPLMEIPLLRHINQGSNYSDTEIRDYTIQAIRAGEITFKTNNDEETTIMTKVVLKGCKESSLSSNQNKKKVNSIKEQIQLLSIDPMVRRDAKERRRSVSRGRVFSETEQTGDPFSVSKVSQITSPPKK